MAAKTELERKIPDVLMQFIDGGTEQENAEMYEYIQRKFPEFAGLPRDFAIGAALLSYLPVGHVELSQYDSSLKNKCVLKDGRAVGHAEMMAMLKEKYGD